MSGAVGSNPALTRSGFLFFWLTRSFVLRPSGLMISAVPREMRSKDSLRDIRVMRCFKEGFRECLDFCADPDFHLLNVDFDDTHLQLISGLQGSGFFLLDLGRINERLHIVVELDKNAEIRIQNNLGIGFRINGIFLGNFWPRVFHELFKTKIDLPAARVNGQNAHLHVMPLLQNILWMIDLSGPGHIRNMDHSLQARIKFHKRTIICKTAYFTLDPIGYFFSAPNQGFSSSCFMLKEIRLESLSTLMIWTSISSPTLNISWGFTSFFCQVISEE